MKKRMFSGLMAVLLGVVVLCLSPARSPAEEDDLEALKVPVFVNDDDYAIAITEYEMTTKAELLEEDAPKHEIELIALLHPPADLDVLCFRSRLVAEKALNGDDDELLLRGRGRDNTKFAALQPIVGFADADDEPLLAAESKMESVELSRPGYEVEMLTLEVTAVVVDETASAEMPAVVADEFVDIGNGTEIMIQKMEIDNKGNMNIEMKLQRSGGKDEPVIHSMFALDADGEVIGGGRWINELELFNTRYEVELKFPLQDRTTATKLRVVLATEYEVETVRFKLKDLFKK